MSNTTTQPLAFPLEKKAFVSALQKPGTPRWQKGIADAIEHLDGNIEGNEHEKKRRKRQVLEGEDGI